ncbi:MAG: pirin family protein [Synergistaceae bacterium]|nr:pirin family protein [Synergistaceae bacterium]
MERKIIKTVQGQMATDGAGVRLVRVLGHETVRDFDPFLMLDSFDSRNPDDYTAGFPFHPHRGIETITYLIEGEMEHQDSLGNRGTIHGGESQWMTAGSGIMHQEMPMAGPRMLGLQIWLNLPQEDKMTAPRYFDIKDETSRTK